MYINVTLKYFFVCICRLGLQSTSLDYIHGTLIRIIPHSFHVPTVLFRKGPTFHQVTIETSQIGYWWRTSYSPRTTIAEMLCHQRTYAGTPVGLWSAKVQSVITCWNELIAVKTCTRHSKASMLCGSSSFSLNTPDLVGLYGSRHIVG